MMNKPKYKLIDGFATGFVIVAFALISGCAHPPGPVFAPLDTSLVWPQPPEKARITYVGSLMSESDLKPGTSFTEALTQAVFGKREVAVMISPTAVVSDGQTVVVADSSVGVVHMFDILTRKYRQISRLSNGEQLRMPVAVAQAPELLFIADSAGSKVCVFDKTGDFKSTIGQDVLVRPTGLAYVGSQRKLYVTDTANHKIHVFNEDGKWLFEFGSRGVEPGKFNFPTHLWADKEGKVYVSDTLNYRVQVFSSDGIFLRMFGVHGDRPGNFAHPAGIATDSAGHIYVVDKQYENVQVFDDKGNILMAFGGEGSEPGNFWLPAGIFISDDDRIYIADSFNKRVQVFDFVKDQDDEI